MNSEKVAQSIDGIQNFIVKSKFLEWFFFFFWMLYYGIVEKLNHVKRKLFSKVCELTVINILQKCRKNRLKSDIRGFRWISESIWYEASQKIRYHIWHKKVSFFDFPLTKSLFQYPHNTLHKKILWSQHLITTKFCNICNEIFVNA